MISPRPRAVVLGSLSLFAVLFVVLALQLSAQASTPGEKAKATAGHRSVPAETRTAEPEAVEEPATEYLEPEPEYVEPEVEEAPPVVTSSS